MRIKGNDILTKEKTAQYACANTTLRSEGLPVSMHFPFSDFPSIGMQRIVALVSSFIFSSVSEVPSQCAYTKPPFSIAFLNSSYVFTLMVLCSRKDRAFW